MIVLRRSWTNAPEHHYALLRTVAQRDMGQDLGQNEDLGRRSQAASPPRRGVRSMAQRPVGSPPSFLRDTRRYPTPRGNVTPHTPGPRRARGQPPSGRPSPAATTAPALSTLRDLDSMRPPALQVLSALPSTPLAGWPCYDDCSVCPCRPSSEIGTHSKAFLPA